MNMKLEVLNTNKEGRERERGMEVIEFLDEEEPEQVVNISKLSVTIM